MRAGCFLVTLHGEPVGPVALPDDDEDDPHMFLVAADMGTWLALRSECRCEGTCECDGG